MLFFYDDELKKHESYLKNETNKLIEYFNHTKEILEQQHQIILKCMKNTTDIIDNIQSTQDIDDFSILFTTLEKIRNAFCAITTSSKTIGDIINKLKNIKNLLNQDFLDNSIFDYINALNLFYDNSEPQIQQNNTIIYDFLNYYLSNSQLNYNMYLATNQNTIIENVKTTHIVNEEKEPITSVSKVDNINKNQTINTNNIEKTQTFENQENTQKDSNKDSIFPLDNPKLIISEKEKLVYLPYFFEDIKKIFNRNKESYIDLQDVIQKNYILPLSRFKNPVISRFKEAFYLMRHKQKSSFAKALDLALELSFNSLLNPAVICACRNLDELNIYLDYLETNEIDKFKIFEVKYEIMPIKI